MLSEETRLSLLTGDRVLDGVVAEMADRLDEDRSSRLLELCDRLDATRSQRSRVRQAEDILREFPELDGSQLLLMARYGARPGMLRVSMLFGLYFAERSNDLLGERSDLLERAAAVPVPDVTSWLR